MKLYTYLNYGGNCREAFEFYQQHLGGKITMMMMQSELPPPRKPIPGWEDRIVHARMELGDTLLLGADIPPERFKPLEADGLIHRRLATLPRVRGGSPVTCRRSATSSSAQRIAARSELNRIQRRVRATPSSGSRQREPAPGYRVRARDRRCRGRRVRG